MSSDVESYFRERWARRLAQGGSRLVLPRISPLDSPKPLGDPVGGLQIGRTWLDDAVYSLPAERIQAPDPEQLPQRLQAVRELVEAGVLYLVPGNWYDDWLRELECWPLPVEPQGDRDGE